MGLLDRYARTGEEERKTMSVGSRIEPSLYKKFVEHCQKINLKPAEAVRYLIIELLSDEVNEEITKGKQEVSSAISVESLIENQKKTERKPQENKTKSSKNKGKAASITQWVINKEAPCPICKTWSSRPNFHRSHSSKHEGGYPNSYEFLNAHRETVEKMYQERLEKNQKSKDGLAEG